MKRRKFLKLSAAVVSGAELLNSNWPSSLARAAERKSPVASDKTGAITARDYLKGLLYTPEEVRQWLEEKAFPFAKYSSEFGWLLRNARFQDGVDGSTSVYTYGSLDERITINYKDRPCRINTYGNSFTQCHQVSDGETWQEVLAAHLQEPVRNFGVGGWSVYQAYRRMLKEEQRAPSEFIIFNIYDDDHFRNLDSWRNIRVQKHERLIEPTLPYVVVNAKEGIFEERPNPCPTPESVYKLCDLDWVVETFKDDFSLKIMLAHLNAKTGNPELAYKETMKLVTTHGIITRIDTVETLSQAANQLHQQSAYYSTRRIVEKVEAFAREQHKKVLYVLSYSRKSIEQFILTGERRDKVFVEFMQKSGLPVVDLLAAHVSDFAKFKVELKGYLTNYFVGHYNPLGNFFCAQTIKPRLVKLLEPKPLPYQPATNIMK